MATRYTPEHVPAYGLHRATGQAIVRLGGRDHYLGAHGTAASRRAYDRLIAEWLAAGRSGGGPAPVTVGSLMAAWLEHLRRRHGRLPPMTVAALRPVRRLYGRQPVDAFGPLALLAVRDRYVAAGAPRVGVNRRVGVVRRMFKWGVSREIVAETIHRALLSVEGLRAGETIAPDRPPVRPVDLADVLAIEPHIGRVVWSMIELQLLTGARPGEICQLRPCDVERGGELWVYRPASHKTARLGHERIIELGPAGQRVLAPFLVRPAEAYCFSPREAVREHNAALRAARRTPLWPSHLSEARALRRYGRQGVTYLVGEHYTAGSYRRAIHRACDRAGVARWSPHRLRHLRATEIRARYGIEAARVVLGHRSIDVTEIYAEADRSQARRIASEVG